MTLEEVAHRFNATRSGDGYTAHCPGHKDNRKSLCINQKLDKVLIKCQAGCPTDTVLAAVGLTMKDLFENAHSPSQVVATYIYRDLEGVVRYRKIRTADKEFFFNKKVDGKDEWICSKKQNGGKAVMEGVPHILYRVNELREQSEGAATDIFRVYVTEGEKDADRLWSLGLPATTNDGGASKWTDEYTRQLKAVGVTHVALLPDNDDPGRAHMQAVAQSCHAAGIEVQIVELPGLASKGDVSDYLDAGNTDLSDRIASAPSYPPPFPSESNASTPEDLHVFLARMEQQPDLSWHVAGLIPDEGICLWHGQPRDFKSMTAQEVSLALASGRNAFCNSRFAVSKPVKVAYFTEEDSERLFAARMHWLTAKNQKPKPNFFFPFIRKSLSFDVAADRDFIVRELRVRAPRHREQSFHGIVITRSTPS